MFLRILDQILVTAIRNDVLRAGEQIEITDAKGAALIASHPQYFLRIDEAEGEGADATPTAAKRRKQQAATSA